MARKTIENAMEGQIDPLLDPAIRKRVDYLVEQVKITLKAIAGLAPAGVEDPLTDAATLAKAVSVGILDAPQLRNNPFARGKNRTGIINGASKELDEQGRHLTEEHRLASFI